MFGRRVGRLVGKGANRAPVAGHVTGYRGQGRGARGSPNGTFGRGKGKGYRVRTAVT